MKWSELFVLYHAYLTYCLAMSKEDLEGFIKFINNTSRWEYNNLSPSLEESIVSDVRDWEDGDKFEGDMILNDRQRKMIINAVAGGLSRNGLRDLTKRWPDATVVYSIKSSEFSASQINEIKQAMNEIASVSCVKFREKRIVLDKNYLRITGRYRHCQSDIGYQGGKQRINIPSTSRVGEGCFRRGAIIHELLHVLGFIHMQCNFNRDDYVTVLWDNIIKGNEYNFRKYGTDIITDYDLAYDYGSILHYGRRAFSINKNKLDTLVPKDEDAIIGQRFRMSEIDIKKINKMYCSNRERLAVIGLDTETKKQEGLVLKSLVNGG